jgi:HPt (histidine-containing phosphotransfer) domain-containing protein
MTANAFKRDINLYIKAGFDDYLIKPFREAELYNKLCTILEIKKPESYNKMTMVEHRNSSHIQVDNFNTKELLKTANNDLAFFEKMVNNFILSSQALINVFIEEVANGNWNEIGEKAHKAIPSFKYFELFKIAAALSNIEDKTLRKVDYPSAATTIEQTIIQIKDAIEQAKASLGQKM